MLLAFFSMYVYAIISVVFVLSFISCVFFVGYILILVSYMPGMISLARSRLVCAYTELVLRTWLLGSISLDYRRMKNQHGRWAL